MKRLEYSDKIKAIELLGLNDLPESRDIPGIMLPRRYLHGSSMMHISSSSQILDKLYNDQGIRVRMVRRGRPNRIPTVRELIDHLTKKHENLLELEAKGNKLETGQKDAGFKLDTVQCMSESRSDIGDLVNRERYRCLSDRPTRFEVWDPDSIGSLAVTGRREKPPSSSTPTVPYSTADILYGSELNGNRVPQNDDVRQNSFGDSERSRDSARQKSKELEQSANNRRPSSKSGKQKSLTIDSVAPFDKDREDPLKSLSSTLPPAKPSHHFRPNGIRSNIVKPDILFCPKPNGAVTGRDQDDLVAMGTLWSPNNNPAQPPPPVAFSSTLIAQQQQQQQSGSRNNSVSNGNTNIFPSKAVSANSVNQSMSSTNNTLNTQRKYPGNNIRPIVVQNNVPGKKVSNSMKEQEDPKYTDPMFGAPASFQQRIIELGALEGDTVRWERSKRLKKKKQDRDS